MTQLAGYFEPLIKASVGVASKLNDHQQQMTFLDQTKTLAESALQMLYAAKEGGGNPKAKTTFGLLCLMHFVQTSAEFGAPHLIIKLQLSEDIYLAPLVPCHPSQASHTHDAIAEAAQLMKEAVDDIMVTLNEAASEVGMVGGMVESIAEAMAKVSSAGCLVSYEMFDEASYSKVIIEYPHPLSVLVKKSCPDHISKSCQ